MKAATLPALAAATAAVITARAWLRLAPAGAVRWASVPAAVDPQTNEQSSPAIEPLAWAVAAAGASLGASCLEQGVALTALLSLVRVPAHLVIGVNRSGGALRAHAWVESRGRVVLGAVEAHDYSALPAAGGELAPAFRQA